MSQDKWKELIKKLEQIARSRGWKALTIGAIVLAGLTAQCATQASCVALTITTPQGAVVKAHRDFADGRALDTFLAVLETSPDLALFGLPRGHVDTIAVLMGTCEDRLSEGTER